jgi:hypothetical protein
MRQPIEANQVSEKPIGWHYPLILPVGTNKVGKN